MVIRHDKRTRPWHTRTSGTAVRWGLGAAAAIGILTWLILSPVGKPRDVSRRMYLSPQFSMLKREMIGTQTNARGAPHLPRFVHLQSNGPAFRAYLLDLSSIEVSADKVSAFMTASADIERGREPTTAAITATAIDVTEVRFNLHSWPWGWNADYMLIVFSNEETEVDVRISYGR